jgi:hypothetical protein
MANEALEKQALSDTITIEDVKQFISDARTKRENFINIADRSWREIEKLNEKGRLYGGNNLDRQRRWTKFPLWWSVWKIRQPLVFARMAVPILKDTQGDDPYGRTACVIGERLTRGILKTFDAFEEFESSVDDFLITNFGQGRPYYRKDEVVEEEKIRLQVVEQPAPEPIMDEQGQPMESEPLPPLFITPNGEQVPQEQVLSDDMGPYILSGAEIAIDNEEIYWTAGLYNNMYIDPDAKRWSQVTRIAYECEYSYREFKEKFGEKALNKLAVDDYEEHRSGKPIKVFEYYDKFLKEVRWFAENSADFFQPKAMAEANTSALKEVKEAPESGESEAVEYETVDNSDIYGLSGFFPCTAPLVMNQSTREFWPTPEYFQVQDILDDIHSIVGRMFLLTKAIRVRFLFDSSVTELKSLIGETGEGGGLGVPNLEQSLMNNNGKLSNLVAYFPVAEMIEGLQNMYQAFEQRLNMFYQLTGISDLIRGQTNPDSDKTFGERQMEGKFSLNRVEPLQRKVQEWVKDNYQLMMEMALKMFSQESLDQYITPQTLDPEDKQRYVAALEILKNNKRRRFRVDFETDSTIAINEQWRKKQATELANTLTKAMESVANVAETQPELAGTELAVLKHLIGEFSDGKLFIDEIQDSIEQVIQKVSQPKPEGPNPDEMKMQLESAKLQLEREKMTSDMQLEQLKLQSEQQIEIARIQRDDRLANIESQLTQFKIQGEQQLKQLEMQMNAEESRAQLEKEYQKISADISLAQQDIELKRQELLVELRKVADKKEVDQLSLMIDQRVAGFEAQLEQSKLELEKTVTMLDMKERYITEERLQAEHQLQLGHSRIDSLEKVLNVALKKKEFDAPIEASKIAESSESKPKKPKKTRSKVVRDKNDNIIEILNEEIE